MCSNGSTCLYVGASVSGTSTPHAEVPGSSNWSQVSNAPSILPPPSQDALATSQPPSNGFVPHSRPPPTSVVSQQPPVHS